MHNLQFYLDEMAKDDLIYIFLPLFLLALAIEYYYSRKNNLDLFEKKDTVSSLWMTVFVVFVDILPKLGALVLFFYLHSISPLADIIQRQWWAWVILFFLDDFTYYLMHRANHEVRLFWAGHVSHHSAIKMNYATALRQGVMERVHKYAFWIPLPLLGFDPLMIFTMMSINLFYQFWLHTELVKRLPNWFESIFNTPSHHRVHHASNIRYLDCNHAGVLIIWDKLLGTFSAEKDNEPPVYGLTTNITSYNPFYVATHEYSAIAADVRRANTLADKLRYVFKSPGWSHDGEDNRAKVLRAKLFESEK